jgi:hypothetical protein
MLWTALQSATLAFLLGSAGALSSPQIGEPDPEDIKKFMTHMRTNFEDIHVVSMRFHKDDPTIGGLIRIRMVWRDGQLEQAEILENRTGCAEEGPALIDAIRQWNIPSLVGPAEIDLPLRIKLVGSDDPTFPEKAILTGDVRDDSGQPLRGASIRFHSLSMPMDAVPDARSNVEGVFVRTLIPAGSWVVTCSAPGYREQSLSSIQLGAGQHKLVHFVLKDR